MPDGHRFTRRVYLTHPDRGDIAVYSRRGRLVAVHHDDPESGVVCMTSAQAQFWLRAMESDDR